MIYWFHFFATFEVILNFLTVKNVFVLLKTE